MAPEKAPQKFSRSWDALTPPLADFILEAVASMGFNELTPVQAATLPLFRGNKDVVVEVSLDAQEQINTTMIDLDFTDKNTPGCDGQRQDLGLSQ